jgi:hypothetical protein
MDTPVSSTNKTDCHDIAEIFLKVALSAIKQTKKQTIISTSSNLLQVTDKLYHIMLYTSP